jgi:hypothetical protein
MNHINASGRYGPPPELLAGLEGASESFPMPLPEAKNSSIQSQPRGMTELHSPTLDRIPDTIRRLEEHELSQLFEGIDEAPLESFLIECLLV